jgi:hypothetical protein
MKKILIVSIVGWLVCISMPLNAQLLNDAKKMMGQGGGGYSETEAADGIREALINGTGNGVKLVAVQDGYFGNPEIKIPFPPEAKEMESKLRSIGMGKQVDETVLSINRAAEDAAKDAKDIFVAAIRNLSVKDAIKIVKGDHDAATRYLQNNTSVQLNATFRPTIKSSLDKVEATKHWEELIKAYNKIPFVKKMNPNLTEYVTGKAIDGLFIMIAKEEDKIRKDPMARTSELLKKVFGNN